MAPSGRIQAKPEGASSNGRIGDMDATQLAAAIEQLSAFAGEIDAGRLVAEPEQRAYVAGALHALQSIADTGS